MEANSIEKALLVLKHFSEGNQPTGTMELAQKLEINKATMSRILTTLKRHDFLEHDPRTKQYRFGPVVALMAKAITLSLDGQMAIIAQPYIEKLRDKVGETVHLEIISGNHMYLAYIARGFQPVTVALYVGDQVMPNVHAGAKAMAAFSSPEKIDRWLAGDLAVYSPKSITNVTKIREKYQEIRESGIAIDDGEFDENIFALATPIFNHSGFAVGAIVIIVPSMRKNDLWRPHVVPALKETATAISARLLSIKDCETIKNSHTLFSDNE